MRARFFITLAALFLLAACAGMGGSHGSRDLTKPGPAGDQRIVMWHKPSHERIDVMFRRNGVYDPAAFEQIDRIFRDRHVNETYLIDPQLIELIAGLRDRMVMAQDTPIELLSGYRSPESNEILSRTNKYVAKQSYHMRGMAADIRIPDMNSRALELVAKTIQKGGVALYPDSGHVHVDTGPVRGWEVIKGQEAGLQKREGKAREIAAKTELVPLMDKLPPVTVSKLSTPTAKIEKNDPMKVTPKTKAVSMKPPAKKATPVYGKTKARNAPLKAKPVLQKAPAKSARKVPAKKVAPKAEDAPAPLPIKKTVDPSVNELPAAAPIPAAPAEAAPVDTSPADTDTTPDNAPDAGSSDAPASSPDSSPDTN